MDEPMDDAGNQRTQETVHPLLTHLDELWHLPHFDAPHALSVLFFGNHRSLVDVYGHLRVIESPLADQYSSGWMRNVYRRFARL